MTQDLSSSGNQLSGLQAPRWGRVGVGFFALLLVSRLVMLVPAFQELLLGEGGVDLESRRAELELAVHGVSPVAGVLRLEDDTRVARGLEPKYRNRDLPERKELLVGSLSDGDFRSFNSSFGAYPQWSYPLMAPLIWPGPPLTRPYYAAVLVASLALLCWWSTRLFDGSWKLLALLVVLLPMPSWSAAVFTGQLGIPLLVLLVGFGLALERDKWILAGLLLGLAAMKPTFTTLFAVALLFPVLRSQRPDWRRPVLVAAVAGGVVTSSSLFMWWRTKVDPLEAMRLLTLGNEDTLERGYGLLPRLLALDPSPQFQQLVTSGLALGALVLAVVVCGLWLRRQSLLLWFAILGLLSRLWTYHRHYDDVLLLFLLLALAQLGRRGSVLALGALLVMALTLASPLPHSERFEIWRVSVWILAGAIAVWEAQRWSPTSRLDQHAT